MSVSKALDKLPCSMHAIFDGWLMVGFASSCSTHLFFEYFKDSQLTLLMQSPPEGGLIGYQFLKFHNGQFPENKVS